MYEIDSNIFYNRLFDHMSFFKLLSAICCCAHTGWNPGPGIWVCSLKMLGLPPSCTWYSHRICKQHQPRDCLTLDIHVDEMDLAWFSYWVLALTRGALPNLVALLSIHFWVKADIWVDTLADFGWISTPVEWNSRSQLESSKFSDREPLEQLRTLRQCCQASR